MIDVHADSLVQVPKLTWEAGREQRGFDRVATEVAVALEYNGIAHAVMMASPNDLEDFALGFSLSEGILDNPEQLLDIDVRVSAKGMTLQMSIPQSAFFRLKERRRNLAGRTGCGLCGAESLDQVVPDIAPIVSRHPVTHDALQAAFALLPESQPLQQETGAVHAAAWCDAAGTIKLLREDIGRHNALDKLVGAYKKSGLAGAGFVAITSRASYEMVLKTAKAEIGILAAISAPSSLAIALAERCQLTLVGFARNDRHSIYSHAERIVQDARA